MSYEMIAILMFSSMMLMLLTGQRVFGAIGFVAVVAALLLWGDAAVTTRLLGRDEADEMVSAADAADVHLHGLRAVGEPIADDLYKMFHVWMGGLTAGWPSAPSG
jgi:drug/metabolite transporter (DMT)-like permease